MAGLPNVKLYAGSMVDWTQSKDAPRMANQPGRAQSLAYDAQKWWEKTFNNPLSRFAPSPSRAPPRGQTPSLQGGLCSLSLIWVHALCGKCVALLTHQFH
jgi:hypothetical protein